MPTKSTQKKSVKKYAKPGVVAHQIFPKAANLKENAPVYGSPFKKPPLPQLKGPYAKAMQDEKKRTYQERLKDWTYVKSSGNGTSSRRPKVTFLLPEGGGSFQI